MSQPLQTTVPLPLTTTAFHRFGMQAQALGISLEAYLARLSERGFGMSLAKLVSSAFEDAAVEMAAKERAVRDGKPRLFSNPSTPKTAA